jgi:uncharacterized protein YaiE (UPF0345 family)
MDCLRRGLRLLACASLVCAAAAHADTVFLKARLDGAQAGVLTNADGSALFTYDTVTQSLTWTVNYRNLSSALNAAHIHGPAAPGSSAPILIPFSPSASPLSGNATITAPQAADMLAGLWYVNVHTDNYPNGEIRGQMGPIDSNFYEVASEYPGPMRPFPSALIGGTVTLDPSTLQMTWNIGWEAQLKDTAHFAAFYGPARSPDETAPITITATITPITGSATLTPAQAAEVVNGFWYFRVDEFEAHPAAQVLPSHPRLSNISTRGRVSTGENVMIGGFVIDGTTPKSVAVVATGPSLSAFGIAAPLANPTLTVVRSSDQSVIATNDDWRSAPLSGTALQIAGYAPSDSAEAGVLLSNLAPGAYTAIVSGVGATSGVAVIAVYELDHAEVPLSNISTRGLVLTGEDVMIGGFIIQGHGPQTVAIVATGPSLAAFGIVNPLADPNLTLVRSSDQAVIATNDDWQSAANAADLVAAGFAPSHPQESAILITLDPGAYTVIVSGASVGGGTGVAVIGVYAVH